MAKLSVRNLNLKDKFVLMRVDFNVPLEGGKVMDDTRIRESLPTIRYILDRGGKLILMSHLGRPKGKPTPEASLRPTGEKLSELLGKPVPLAPDCIGPEVEKMKAGLKSGDVILLENLRFHDEEEKNDPKFAEALSKLGDVYVNDAFGTAHRAHASTEGVTKFFSQNAAGFLLEKEIQYLGAAIANPKRPFIAILGGAKISGKIDVIQNLMVKVDSLIIGGGMAYTFFKAQGLEIGKSLLEEDKISLAAEILQQAKSKGIELLLPVDCVVADAFSEDANNKIVSYNGIPQEWQGLDIGPKTVALFTEKILTAKTIVWNGPVGVFEMDKFATGTNAIAEALVKATAKGAVTVIGGGETAAAVAKAGLSDKVTHVSTGGGASLEYLEGKILPGIAALTDL